MKPFVELSSLTTMVCSLDFEESLEYNDLTSYPRAASLRFDPSSVSKLGSCSSSRFSFTVSHHLDSLKPWYLSLADTSASKVGPTNPSFSGPAISPLNARSYSFASPVARGPRGNIDVVRKNFFPSTPMPQKTQKIDPSMIHHPRTPKPSFLHSPAMFFRKDSNQVTRLEKTRESFVPFLKFYRRPYDEMIYRSKMKPPLGGLISIVSPHLKRNRHMSYSQRFWSRVHSISNTNPFIVSWKGIYCIVRTTINFVKNRLRAMWDVKKRAVYIKVAFSAKKWSSLWFV